MVRTIDGLLLFEKTDWTPRKNLILARWYNYLRL